jgi:predicted RNA-binding Zn-ribbon protein involved in translation (DUF1610 family)
LREQMGYKHQWYQGVLLLADRWFPSSKMCSNSHCRQINHQLKRSATIFRCPSCGLVLDRDLNAARNLEALAQLAALAVLCQMATGVPVDWSKLPVRPWGWQPPRVVARSHTRSSRGSARASNHPAGTVKGGDVRHPSSQPRAGPARARSFDREDRRPHGGGPA